MDFMIGLLGVGIGLGLMPIMLVWFQRRWRKRDEREVRATIEPQKLDAMIAPRKVLIVDRVRYLGHSYILDRQSLWGLRRRWRRCMALTGAPREHRYGRTGQVQGCG